MVYIDPLRKGKLITVPGSLSAGVKQFMKIWKCSAGTI